MISKLGLYYRTLRHLKLKQIQYQLWYRLKKTWEKGIDLKDFNHQPQVIPVEKIYWKPSVNPPVKLVISPNTFRFLNLETSFENIDWNEAKHGKLWTYNLTYFEFLLQEDIEVKEKLRYLHDFIEKKEKIKDGFEPYPISLRTIFGVRFIIENQIKDPKIDQLLYGQLLHLKKNIEYHLLGNHLLENGFAFLFGAIYFNNTSFQKIAEKILTAELKEQILKDGSHFELSPMYHQIIWYRLLDSINFLEAIENQFSKKFKDSCKEYAKRMASFLRQITFKNGQIPLLNDATVGIAPTSNTLFDYANRLEIEANDIPLSESGYRKMICKEMEVIVDVGNIGPDYIPGHAHSDSLSFVLQDQLKAIFVDTGISTYNAGEDRMRERSTQSHNTVRINNEEQTEIWGGFRVGRRAYTQILVDQKNDIQAKHNGYQHLSTEHIRTFKVENNQFMITDELTNSNNLKASAYFHIHPDVKIIKNEEYIMLNSLKMIVKGDICVAFEKYQYCLGYNAQKTATKIRVDFKNTLKTIFN